MTVRVIRHDRNGDGPTIVLLAGWRQRVLNLARQADLTHWCWTRGVDLLLLEKHGGWWDAAGHLNWTPRDRIATEDVLADLWGERGGDWYGYGFSDGANHALRCWRVFKGVCYFSGAAGTEQTLDGTDLLAALDGQRLVMCCRRASRRGAAQRTRDLAYRLRVSDRSSFLQHDDQPGWFQHRWHPGLNDAIWNLLTGAGR